MTENIVIIGAGASGLAADMSARGFSGPDVSDYPYGNGLLTAVALGRIARRKVARMIEQGFSG